MHALESQVSALMRDVAARIVMPHHRNLLAADISEKEPDDFVTIADRESEAALAEGLAAILPEARFIGEEGVAADASLLDDIGKGIAWIVDPIDGTGNFAAGEGPFAIMVGLLADGEIEAGWILDPPSGRMLHAARGGGAFADGTPVRTRSTGASLPVAALGTRYLPKDICASLEANAAGHLRCVEIPRCAGEQYARCVLGENDIALYWRALPWDHAPGALILTEAGGRVARFDGTPYRIDQTGTGLLAAATPELWDQAAAILLTR